jgi:hypothetical protein
MTYTKNVWRRIPSLTATTKQEADKRDDQKQHKATMQKPLRSKPTHTTAHAYRKNPEGMMMSFVEIENLQCKVGFCDEEARRWTIKKSLCILHSLLSLLLFWISK